MEEKICHAKIAILMATYNGEKYVGDQIKSILAQSFDDWKLYIHDDGSMDKTVSIIEKYASEFPEKIEIIYSESTGGARNNFFFLMQNVKAQYYMCCDQDDIWNKDKIELSYNKILEIEMDGKKPILVFTDLLVVDEKLHIISKSMNKYQKLQSEKTSIGRMLVHNCVTGCTMIFNDRLCKLSLKYKNKNNIIMHDWWMALCATFYGKCVFLSEPTIKYRQHGDNSVGAVNASSPIYFMKKISTSPKIKKAINDTRKQAREFSESFDLKKDNIIYQYGMISSKSKIQRVLFYKNNHIYKCGLLRNFGFYMWG